MIPEKDNQKTSPKENQIPLDGAFPEKYIDNICKDEDKKVLNFYDSQWKDKNEGGKSFFFSKKKIQTKNHK